MRRFGFSLALIFLLFFSGSSSAFDLAGKVKTFTLENGLRVVILARHGAPIFAARIAFNVGSVEEERGLTGAAHMLEHMLFKGTTTLGSLDWKKEKPLLDEVNRLGAALDKARGEKAPEAEIKALEEKLANAQAEHKKLVVSEIYSSLYSAEGGVGFNAGTSKDTTTYIIRLPANRFELWAAIESDRMKDAVMREYYAERDVVMEERRRSYENRAGGKLYERYLAAAYIAHPYGQPIIGWEDDLARLPLEEVEKFWNTWYVPNNAVIALVGDINFEEARRIITRYFGAIPARPLPPRPVTLEPPQQGERRVTVTFDATPTFIMGFHKPTWPHEDDVVFSVIQEILSGGRTARFYQNIVRDDKIAVSVDTFTVPGSRYPNLFSISGDPAPPHTTADVEKAVWRELDRLKNEPVSAEELARVKTAAEAAFIRGLVSHYGMAHILAWYELITGDWKNFIKEHEMTLAVTAEDIQRVAQRWFTRDNVTVATLEKVAP